MPDNQRAVLISDLHLCSNARLNDFAGDAAVAALVDAEGVVPGAGEAVDLVLLGDTFDLWQSVKDDECRHDQGRDIPLGFDPASEIAKIDEISMRHPAVFEALGRFAARPKCRLVMVTGNHDHLLVDASVQARLRSLLKNPAPERLVFDSYYASNALKLYADHGSQYDVDNAYEKWTSIGLPDEAAGYFFVKLFFNRVEFVDPRVENSPSGWNGIWHWLRRVVDFGLVAKAIRWFWQYGSDPRVVRRLGFMPGPGGQKRATTRRGPTAPTRAAVPASMTAAPGLLVAGPQARSKERFFSLDTEMEEFFRVAYQDSPEVRAAVNDVLEDQESPTKLSRRAKKRSPAASRRGRGGAVPTRSEVPPPRGRSRAAAGRRGGRRGDLTVEREREVPKDVSWAANLFTTAKGFAGQLKPDVRYVVFGHTHNALTQVLPNGATYLNTGTWASPDRSLPVVVAEASAGGAPMAALKHLVDGRIVPS